MATSKVNIFSSLAHHGSDSEEEGDFKNVKAKKPTDKKDQQVRRTDDKSKPKDSGNKPAPVGALNVHRPDKEEHARTKEARKEKGVPDQAHPHDRQSGTGQQAFGNKPKKGGAGRGNWGKADRERVPGEEGEERTAGADEEEVPKEEEKPSLTLQEYYQQRAGTAQNQPQVNEAKAKITREDLIKDLGTSTQLETKAQREVDDRRAGKKKDRIDVNHHAGVTTEHADLLNFRTGFVEKEYKQRSLEEGGDQRRGPRTGAPKPREEGKTEEENPASPTKAAGETAEGAAPVGEQGVVGEGTEQQEGGQERRGGRGGRGGRGERGGRGARGGPRDDNRYQGQGQGERKPYQQGKQSEKINFGDESAFPKLG